MKKPQKSRTDWERVRKNVAKDTRIPYSPEDGPYDPNDRAATNAYWDTAIVRHRGQRGPQRLPTKERITIRLSPEVVEHFRSTGSGWQTRMDEALRKSIKHKTK